MSRFADLDPGPAPRRALAGVVAWVAMLALLAAMAGFALDRPAGNADLVDYVATAHSWEGLSGQALSDATYADLRAFLSPGQFDNVTGAGDKSLQRNVYLATMAADPVSLTQQIPFYSVKPLYPGLMVALHAVGVPLPLSSLLISIVSFIVFGILVFLWMRRHHQSLIAFVLAGLIVASPPFAALASLSTPDALGLLLMTGAAFAFAELRRVPLAVGLLALTVLARPNAVIFAVALIAAAAIASRSSGVRVRPAAAVGAVAGVGLVVFAVSRVMGAYPYPVLFADALLGYLPYPANGVPAMAISEVARLYVLLAAQLTATFIPVAALLAVVALRLRVHGFAEIRDDAPALLVAASMLAAAAGWLVFPNEPDRMLVGSYLAIVAVLAASAHRRSTDAETASAEGLARLAETAA
jgi:hypothetical protein